MTIKLGKINHTKQVKTGFNPVEIPEEQQKQINEYIIAQLESADKVYSRLSLDPHLSGVFGWGYLIGQSMNIQNLNRRAKTLSVIYTTLEATIKSAQETMKQKKGGNNDD